MELSVPVPFSFVLFGASGHLAKIKLYPALYVLALKKRLPEAFSIVGFSRSPLNDSSFRALVEESIRTHMSPVNEHILHDLLSHVYYQQGNYDSTQDFQALAEKLDTLEQAHANCVRLAYFSIPPSVFGDVAHNLCKGGVHKPQAPFRCIVEKPVGNDLQSFERIRTLLTRCFSEGEIYLLDHYLGKEAVRNVYYLRYANPFLERLFKNTLIHHMEITASESAGIEGRAGYFERAGVLQDMFQSHMIMIMALLTMRLREESGSFASSRSDAVRQLYLPPAASLHDIILQGQYAAGEGSTQALGYQQEEGVTQDSRTNTFIAMRLMSRTSRWEGVPFYMRSGKRLAAKETRISMQFLAPYPVGEGSYPNRLDIILQGEAGMRIHLQTKLGGTEPKFRPLILEDPLVCFGDCLPEHGLLLLEAIHGKKQWFLTFEEVQMAWRLIDPLQVYLMSPETPLYLYPAGSQGPEEMHPWIARDHTQWLPS